MASKLQQTLLDRLRLLFAVIHYRARLVRLALKLRPIAGAAEADADGDSSGEGDSDSDDDTAASTAASGDADDDTDGEGSDDGSDGDKSSHREPDWKRLSRKHEREAKKARQEAEQLRKRLSAREDQDKSETEKRIEEAEQRARSEVQAQFDEERREDRLELATTKLATRGVTVGTGNDAKRMKFADPDDAMVHLDRAIRNGDVDRDDIFDENGKVRSDHLEEALADLLDRKPHLAADGKPGKQVSGSADAGRGGPARPDDSVDAHLNKIRRHKSQNEDARFRRAA